MRTNKRRDLNSSQRSVVAVRYEELCNEIREQVEIEKRKKQSENAVNRYTNKEIEIVNDIENKEDGLASANFLAKPRDYKEEHKNDTTQKIAEIFNTNRQYISDVKKIKESNPTLIDEIEKGKITVPEAKKQIKKEEIKQKIIENSKKDLPTNITLLEGDFFDKIKEVEDNSYKI